MANVVWSLQGNAASIEKALQSTSSKYDEVAKKAKKAGEDSGKGSAVAGRGLQDQAKAASGAEKAMASLGKQVVALGAGYLALGTITRTVSAAFQAEQAAMARAAELHASALERAASFGRGRAGGGIALDDELRRRLLDQPVSSGMVLPQSQRGALVGAMQGAFGDINIDQIVAGVQAASAVAGALSSSELELFARNIATLQKLPLGVDQAGIENVALRATQRNVDLAPFSQAFERGAAMGLQGEDLQQLVALGVGAGASSERRAVVANMLNRIDEVMAPTERVAMVGGRAVGVTREGGFDSATEAFRAVTEDPSMMNAMQRAAMLSSLQSGGGREALFGGDAFGELAISDTARAQRAALANAAFLEQSEGLQGDRARRELQARQLTQGLLREQGLPAFAAQGGAGLIGAFQTVRSPEGAATGRAGPLPAVSALLHNVELIANLMPQLLQSQTAPRTLSAGE